MFWVFAFSSCYTCSISYTNINQTHGDRPNNILVPMLVIPSYLPVQPTNCNNQTWFYIESHQETRTIKWLCSTRHAQWRKFSCNLCQIEQDLQCQGESISLRPLSTTRFSKNCNIDPYKLDHKQLSSSTEERTRPTQNRATGYSLNGSSPAITRYASELIFLVLYTSLHAWAHIQKPEGKQC